MDGPAQTLKDPLVLLPGMLSDEVCFEHQIGHLGDLTELSVVLLTEQDSRSAMADHVLSVAPERFALAGISMGAWVAQEVAGRAPERVSKAALLDTWASPISEETTALFREHVELASNGGFDKIVSLAGQRAFSPAGQEDQTLMATHRAMAERVGVDAYLRQMQAMLDPTDWRPYLGLIRCPTLVVHARQDVIFSLAEHEAITRAIAGSELAIVEDSGHASTMEQPQAVTALLRLWIEYF
ncbi:MAG: alpha/beta fold hydrolase [Acidimicrobiales bacterium]